MNQLISQSKSAQWLEEVRALVGSGGLARIEQMLRVRAGLDSGTPASLQDTHLLHVPDLLAIPWHDPDEFEWSHNIQELIPDLRHELDQLLQSGVCQPYTAPFDGPLHGLSKMPGKQAVPESNWPAAREHWTVFSLYRHGRWTEVNTVLWPSAQALIERTPYSPGEGVCSVLEPGGRIQLHTGGCNAVLTCHLPLIVPAGCALQVGLETREWQENQLVVFDDSFVHRAWNDSSERRVCLLWEVWHPGLTEVELAALRVLYPKLLDFD